MCRIRYCEVIYAICVRMHAPCLLSGDCARAGEGSHSHGSATPSASTCSPQALILILTLRSKNITYSCPRERDSLCTAPGSYV